MDKEEMAEGKVVQGWCCGDMRPKSEQRRRRSGLEMASQSWELGKPRCHLCHLPRQAGSSPQDSAPLPKTVLLARLPVNPQRCDGNSDQIFLDSPLFGPLLSGHRGRSSSGLPPNLALTLYPIHLCSCSLPTCPCGYPCTCRGARPTCSRASRALSSADH